MSDTTRLGDHDLSRVGYGAMSLGVLRDDREAAVTLVRRAVELGVDHIDTAQFYADGFVNDVLRTALTGPGRPEGRRAVVVTKVGAVHDPGGTIPLRAAQRPQELRSSVEDNLRSLGTDRLDVVNLRRLETRPGLQARGDQIVDLDDQLATMVALRDEGKIGGIGLSAVGIDSLRRALPTGVVCVQNPYSVISRSHEDLLELCETNDIAWVPFFPLGGGFPGTPKVVDDPVVAEVAARLGISPQQVGLAWLLAHSPNTMLISGTANLQHLTENLAVADVVLDARAMDELDHVAEPGAAPAGELG